MALRLGCDLDGVLADMELALVRLAERLFGPRLKRQKKPRGAATASLSDIVPAQNTDDAPMRHEIQLTPRQRRQLWRHVMATEGFWESLDEIEPGSVARLAALAEERQWEIIFLTKRPTTAGATSQLQSQRWLDAKGFRLPSVYVVNGSRGLIAASLGLDIVVDDTPENCMDVAADSKARAIGVFRNREAALPTALTRLGVHLVHSTDECLNLLCEIDSGLEQQPGAMDRVMKMLGLKQPASV